MLARLLKRAATKLEIQYGYDTGYLRELIDLDTSGAFKLGLASLFTNHRFTLPSGPYYAAKITAARITDCGSCLTLVIRMAEEAGVPNSTIRALLIGDGSDIPPDIALAARYSRAVLDNALELAEITRECKAHWGERGVAGLAAAVASGVFYPVLKRGLGHGSACDSVLTWLKEHGGQERI